MLHKYRAILALAILPVLAIGLAACGGSDDSSDSGSTPAASTAGAGGETVATKSISGVGDVLVDSSGAVLYTNDMETGSKIVCTDECLTEWLPLAAPTGGKPTSSDSAIQSKLGMTKRPDGSSQVTFGGMPLYTFVEDGPGQATGDGFSDSFGGTNFVWTAAQAGGDSTGSGAAPTTQTSSDDGYRY